MPECSCSVLSEQMKSGVSCREGQLTTTVCPGWCPEGSTRHREEAQPTETQAFKRLRNFQRDCIWYRCDHESTHAVEPERLAVTNDTQKASGGRGGVLTK